jgi:flagellar biosynthetic protein FliR
VLAIIIHVPVLAGPLVPNPIKIGLGVLLSMVLVPWKTLPPDAPSMATFTFGFAVGRELLIGTLAGYASVLTFGMLHITGELMGMGTGFTAGRLFNPALESSGSALDQVFVFAATLLFFLLDGHHSFLLGLYRTFDILPLNSPLPDFSLDVLLHMTAELIMIGVQLALPILGALLLVDLALGLLNRVAPQVQVFFLGVPVKISLGLLLLALNFGALLPGISSSIHEIGFRLVRLLGV